MDKLTSLDVSMNEQLSSLVEGLYLKNLKVLHLSRCNFREVLTLILGPACAPCNAVAFFMHCAFLHAGLLLSLFGPYTKPGFLIQDRRVDLQGSLYQL
jgi:hypothetical protein